MGNTVLAPPRRFERFAKTALHLAREANQTVTHQLCALIIKRNRVISVGYNSRKTHPIAKTHMQMLHAEMAAIVRCPEDLQGADVVIARARPSGKPGLSKPCGVCEQILRRCGVRRVYYTLSSNDSRNLKIEEMRL